MGAHQTFEFAEGWNKSLPFAYQVRRSQFDEILFRRAARAGAQAIEGCRVREVEFLADGAGARVHADASKTAAPSRGRRGSSSMPPVAILFSATASKTKRRNSKHNSAALYGHFRVRAVMPTKARRQHLHLLVRSRLVLVHPARRRHDQRRRGGVALLHEDPHRAVREFLPRDHRLCAPLAERLQDAELIADVTATGNYSYACDRAYGASYLLLGDAYTFIDPMFSSGVMLAMNSAVAGAETIDHCLREPRTALRGAEALRRASCATGRRPIRGSSIASRTRPCATCSWGRAICCA